MNKQELGKELAHLTVEERDAIDSIIIEGNKASTSKANMQKLYQLGLVHYSLTDGWKYCGGPISEFFEHRIAANFA